MRRCVVVATVALLCQLPAVSVEAQSGPPNIVLIMSDDMGYGDLTSYGAPDVRTPNIDSLGRDGIRLTDFYANGVLCSPTRAGLISGRYQHRYGIESALGSGPLAEGLIVTGRSLPQLLKNAGYTTGLVGKWHLGVIEEHSPAAHGFDYFFGFRGAFIDFYQHDRGPDNPDLWENDTRIEREGYMTDLISEETVNFIERNTDRPFFVDVAYNAPHWPYQPPDMPSVAPNNAGHLQPHSVDTSTRADYVAMVERVDQGVGDILNALDRLGLAENTLVIFTNDNGGEWLARNDPLFHRKWTVWEGGIRVPTLARWPARIPAGRVSDQVGITMDLTATVLSAANAPVPADTDLEGIDLMPIWTGTEPEVERTLFWRTNVGDQVQRAVRSGDWKLVVDGNATFVFNLRMDPGERDDIANERQDIAARLRPLHDAWLEDITAEAVERGLANPPSSGVVLQSASGLSPDAQECVLEIPEWAPRGSAETARPKIFASITSTCGTAIDVASIRMTVDEEPVVPTPDGTGAKVTVVYVPESSLLEEADHTVTVQALDANGVSGERTWTFYLSDSYLR